MNKLAIAFAIACLATVAHAADPYTFRDYKLGMTLDEFKALPYPELNEEITKKSYGSELDPKTIRLVCSDQENEPYGMKVYGHGLAPTGIRCMWRHSEYTSHLQGLSSGYKNPAGGAWISVGAINSQEVEFDFGPDDAGVQRLYRIHTTGPNSRFDAELEAFTTKWGKPTSVTQEDLQNGMGNHFASGHVKWQNGVSTIELIQRVGDINTMSISYYHDTLFTQAAARAKAQEPPPKL